MILQFHYFHSVGLAVWLSAVSLSICLSVSLLDCRYGCLSARRSIYLPVCLCVSVILFLCFFISLSICLSLRLSVCILMPFCQLDSQFSILLSNDLFVLFNLFAWNIEVIYLCAINDKIFWKKVKKFKKMDNLEGSWGTSLLLPNFEIFFSCSNFLRSQVLRRLATSEAIRIQSLLY